MTLSLAACSIPGKEEKKPEVLTVTPAAFAALPGWQDSIAQRETLPAFVRSCERIAKLADAAPMGADSAVNAGTAGDWRDVCNTAMNTAPQDARAFFEEYFSPVAITKGDSAEGLFTGYYEIELEGSRTRSEQFRYPIYKLPEDVERAGGAPYYSRAKIEGGALRGRKLELLYVSDPVELFFLHVQGSGRVKLPDGSTVGVGYAGANGHTYQSIGTYLIQRGEFAAGTLTAPLLKEWLYAHPDEMDKVLQQNPSYIFFRELTTEAPVGAQGAELTPERSLAVDRAFIPLGLPIWLDTTLPVTSDTGALKPFRQLMVAQDTGSAIKGMVRGDVFFGHGKRAEMLAGHMRQQGRYWALLPVKVAARIPMPVIPKAE